MTVGKLLAIVKELEEAEIAGMDQDMVANVRKWYPDAKLEHFRLMERLREEQNDRFYIPFPPLSFKLCDSPIYRWNYWSNVL